MKRVLCCVGMLLLLSPAVSEGATAELKWQDNSTNETGFTIERRPVDQPGVFTPIGTVGPNVVTYSDTVVSGAGACFQVKAFNAAGSSAPSNEVCVTIPTPPTSPSGVTIKVTVEVGETQQTEGE